MKIKRANDDIYYLHDYIPTRRFNEFQECQNQLSRDIWSYKDGNIEQIERFANELIQAITIITNEINTNNIALVAVPPSKVGKYSPVVESIRLINNWSQMGIIERKFGYYKNIADYSGLLTRVRDVRTSHEGSRATYNDHINSIACARGKLSHLWSTFIIIDDVVTKGTHMEACKDILLNHGAIDRYIVRLAIAKTI